MLSEIIGRSLPKPIVHQLVNREIGKSMQIHGAFKDARIIGHTVNYLIKLNCKRSNLRVRQV